MRAVVVGLFGTVIVAEPLFGTESTSTTGKVCPPSVESEILTFAVEIGAEFVPATSHVTVCVVPACHVACNAESANEFCVVI